MKGPPLNEREDIIITTTITSSSSKPLTRIAITAGAALAIVGADSDRLIEEAQRFVADLGGRVDHGKVRLQQHRGARLRGVVGPAANRLAPADHLAGVLSGDVHPWSRQAHPAHLEALFGGQLGGELDQSEVLLEKVRIVGGMGADTGDAEVGALVQAVAAHQKGQAAEEVAALVEDAVGRREDGVVVED